MPKLETLNWSMIKLALDESYAVYGIDTQENRRKQWADRVLVSNSTTSAFATIREVRGHLIVSFKGSAEIRDWLINATAAPIKYSGIWVHWGFAHAHDSIWHAVRDFLLSYAGRGLPVLFTGHSLGGAMAELSCLKFMEEKYPAPVHMITFGKPNTMFWPRKAKLGYLATQLSVICGSDIVSRMPRFLFGPDIGQKSLYFANNGQDHFFDYEDKMGDFSHREYMQRDWSLRDFGRDHFMRGYTERVAAVLERLGMTKSEDL